MTHGRFCLFAPQPLGSKQLARRVELFAEQLFLVSGELSNRRRAVDAIDDTQRLGGQQVEEFGAVGGDDNLRAFGRLFEVIDQDG